MMKKTIIRPLILLTVLICSAFTANAQFKYGAVLGPTFTNLHFKQDLVTVTGDTGFQAGIQTEMIFPGIGFGIDFGLIYNLTGAKVNLGERLMWADQGYGNEDLRLHQLNIPFHLRFKYTDLSGTEEVIAPFVYVGPDININVAHSKCDAMTFAGGDVALSVGLGAELVKRWQVSASYTWGMTYAMKANILQGYSATTRQWTARVTYFF